MSSISNLWNTVWRGSSAPPTTFEIPSAQVDDSNGLGAELVPNKSYFQLTINQLFLAHARKWHIQIAPMVVAISEFAYAGTATTVPYVVGPGTLDALGSMKIREPLGMVYSDTRVAGLHPYTGGAISFAVVLCQVPIDDISNRFLNVIEATAKTFDFSTMVTPYVAIGEAVLSGINNLFGLNTSAALVGWKQSFDYDGARRLVPGYFALINASDVPRSELWVKERQLCRGESLAKAKPYRDADFVLFSITQPRDGRRNDRNNLPFHRLWLRVVEEANARTEEGLKSLQANFAALSQAITLSPDLTEAQAVELSDDYFARLVALRKQVAGRGLMSGEVASRANGEEAKLVAARTRSMRAFDIS